MKWKKTWFTSRFSRQSIRRVWTARMTQCKNSMYSISNQSKKRKKFSYWRQRWFPRVTGGEWFYFCLFVCYGYICYAFIFFLRMGSTCTRVGSDQKKKYQQNKTKHRPIQKITKNKEKKYQYSKTNQGVENLKAN